MTLNLKQSTNNKDVYIVETLVNILHRCKKVLLIVFKNVINHAYRRYQYELSLSAITFSHANENSEIIQNYAYQDWQPYLEGIVNRVYPPELQLNNANAFWYEVPTFWFGFNYMYFKWTCFIQNLWYARWFWHGTFSFCPHYTSYGVYISQIIRFARVSSVTYFNARNIILTFNCLTFATRLQVW